MKIKRIDTIGYLRSLGMKNSFIDDKHTLEWRPDLQGYLIDGVCLVPISNILEVTYYPKVISFLSEVTKEELADLPIEKSKKKIK